MEIYKDVKNPYAFSSAIDLYKHSKQYIPNLKLSDVKTFLSGQDSFTLFGNFRRKYLKRAVFISRPGLFLTSDLADLSNLSEYNSNVRYLIFILDTFSRKLDIFTAVDKKSTTISNYFNDFLIKQSYNYRYLWVDEGREYMGETLKTLTDKFNIKPYHVKSRIHKAAIAERCIRTIKNRIYKYMNFYNTNRYIDVLQDIVRSYNNKKHWGLCHLTPNIVHRIDDVKYILPELSKLIYKRKFLNYGKLGKKYLNIGPPLFSDSIDNTFELSSYVRVLSLTGESTFYKGYQPLYTIEIFKIRRIVAGPPQTYRIEDLKGNRIDGTFYKQELRKVQLPTHFKVEKVLKSKVINGEKYNLVRFVGYSELFDEWIPSEDLKVLNNESKV